jgi:hypothetical protein
MRRKKEDILKILEVNQKALQQFGVVSLALFGSYVRGEEEGSSDLDFVVEFKKKTFDAYMGLKEFLEDLFGCPVDLVIKETIKPRLRENILREAVHAPGF